MTFEILSTDAGGQYVPSRFKQYNIDRFAPILALLIERHEQTGAATVKFKNFDMKLNPNTALCRLRDAALAIMRGTTFHERVDTDKLRAIWHMYKVHYDNLERCVVISPKHDAVEMQLDQNIIDVELRVGESTFVDDVIHFAALLGHYRLRGTVTIVGILTPGLEQAIRSVSNVIITQTKPNEYILS